MHLPGTIIDNHYQIIQKLGQSEREITYLAKDLQATVEAKCIVEQLDFKQENATNWQIVQEYLLNAIQVLIRLGDHPRIPRIQHHFFIDQQFYLVRQYIDGDLLQQEVENQKFDEASVIYLIQDVLRTLDFIHKTNVIHGDLQPIHLIKRKQDQAYVLIDFAAVHKLGVNQINLQGQLRLKPEVSNDPYLAPEQKTGKSYFSSDIYALGKIAVYALTGRSPLELEQNELDWRSQCRISSKLEAILSRMMHPVVEDRYHSALEVLQDLRPLLKIKQLVGGRYLITSYLGGNEGIETYLANNLRRQYQSPCLIKQIELLQGDDDSKLKLETHFAEELSALERLGHHEQIPQLWDHFEENDEFYLVQEYIQGKSLGQKIAQQNLTTTEIIQILESTLSALELIHQNRLIHRNLKPTNLIIRELDQQVIVTDFGILHDLKARPNGLSDSYYADRQNYWSPEQAAGRPTVGSDLYALGMTIIEALTKTKPGIFTREQTGKLLWEQNLGLDRRLVKIIDKLIELDLGQRYQSATKVLQDLRKINNYGNFSPQSSKIQLRDQSIRQPTRFSFNFPLLIGLLGILCLLGSIEYAFPTLRPLYYRYQGEKLLREKPEAALELFNQGLNLKPQNWQGWAAKGNALANMERYPQALVAYQEATALNPQISDNWEKQGNALLQLDNFSEAIAAYNRALKLDPELPAVYNAQGKALFQLQQYEAALVMQDAALGRDQNNPQFLSDRAQALRQLGQYNEALELFNQVQTTKPNDVQLWQDKALVFEALKRPQEAAKVRREVNNNYVKILQQQPKNADIWIDQGDFLVSTQMYLKAVAAYDEAIKLMPDHYPGWLGKGQALAQLGQNAEALTALNRTLQIHPRSYRAWQAKGMVFQKQNKLSEAIASYDQAISINPDDPSLWLDRGIVFNRQGKYSQGIESLTQASELSIYNVQIWRELAIAWSSLGKDPQAISTLERGLKYYPQNFDLWSLKASIQTRNAQYNEACATYRLSLTSAGQSPATIAAMEQLGCRLN